MDQFSYLSVLLSIILGLAITQVLKGYRGVLLSRARIKFYWPTILWSLTLLLMFVQGWWSMFGMRDMAYWTFATFGVILLQTMLYYMLAAIVFPDFFGTETIDLREHYFGHVRWFMGLVDRAARDEHREVALFSTALRLSRSIWPFTSPSSSGRSVAALTRRDWFQKVQALAGFVGMIAYIVLLFQRLK